MLFAPLGLLLILWLIAPAVLGLLATFTSYGPNSPTFQFVGLDNFAALLGDRDFAAAARNIAVFTLVAVPLEVVIGVGLALLLRQPFRTRGVVRVLLLVPWLISPIANGVMWHFLFSSQVGLLNFGLAALGIAGGSSLLGQKNLALGLTIVVEVWRTAPLVTFLVLPGLWTIPDEMWEQSTLEGASWRSKLLNVALPPIRPLLLAVGLLLIGAALGTFDGILILTGGGPGTATVTPALFSYREAFQISNWPVGGAAAWLIGGTVLLVGAGYLALARRGT